MKQRITKALALTAIASLFFSTSAGAAAGPIKLSSRDSSETQNTYVEGEAIILYNASDVTAKQFNAGTTIFDDVEIVETYDFTEAAAAIQASSGRTKTNHTGFKVSLVKSDKYSTDELIGKLSTDSSIRYAEPNYKVHAMTNDTYYQYQWALDNQGQNAGTKGLDANADTLEPATDTGTKVIAVVDSGINYKHEDLKDVIWNNPLPPEFLEGVHGYDFINEDDDPMDDNGHGSHCSGIIAATANNGTGISGIATSSNIKLMGLKVLDETGTGDSFSIFGAYYYIYLAQSLGINVVAVNNSWGFEVADEEEDIYISIIAATIELVGANGAISVCAAGNESVNNDTTYVAPANIDSSYIISVAASNEKDELAAFSNYGKQSVDLAAPGTNILSTVAYDTFNPSIYDDKDALCQVYESFDEATPVQIMNESGYIDNEQDSEDAGQDAENEDPTVDNEEESEPITENIFSYGLNNSGGNGEVTVELATDTFFGTNKENNASLRWSITGAKSGETYELYIPYTSTPSNTPLYDSAMIIAQGPEGNGDYYTGAGFSTLLVFDSTLDDAGIYNEEEEKYISGVYVYEEYNYWDHLTNETVSSVKNAETRALKLLLTVGNNVRGDFVVYMDDLGISKSNVNSSAFGKYDFYNGTSMATPYVTGAIAIAADLYPKEDALNWKNRILGSVRKSNTLTNYTITGGVLDLTNITNPVFLPPEKPPVPDATTPQQPDTTGQSSETESPQKAAKKGDVISKGNLKYKVTKITASKKTVTCIGPTSKKVKKVTIPNSIKINGSQYQVTAIGKNAFKNCTKLKSVTINKNLTSVGKNIFKGCKKLKKITCKSTNSKVVKKIQKQVKNTKIKVSRTK